MGKWSFSWKPKRFTIGLVIGLCVPLGGLALANSINVMFLPLHFTVNGVDKTPVNNTYTNNGVSVPASLTYHDTTYIPIHFASDLLNIPIQWDGSNNTIRIGQNAPDTYLTDFIPFYIDNQFRIITNSSTSSNNNSYGGYPTLNLDGRTYKNGFAINYTSYTNPYYSTNNTKRVSFNINGQYKNLSFMYGFDNSNSNNSIQSQDTATREILVYGDGHMLWRGDITPGDPPNSATIPISGISNLEIQVLGTNVQYNRTLDIANPMLKN